MDFTNISVNELMPRLEDKRKEMHLSYQNVADACDVSQTTIIRAFKLEVEPSVSLLQRIVATLKYEFIQPPIPPANATNEEYIQHLKDVIEFERKDKKIRLDQKEADKNKDVHEERREKSWWRASTIILMLAFVALFFYDFSHLDRGWIQEYLKSHDLVSRVYLAVTGLFQRWM